MSFLYTTLILFLIYASVVDIRERRIPNWLCGLVLILGISCNSILITPTGFYNSIVGLSFGFITFVIMHGMTGLGAGDVKLMAAVGSAVGFQLSLEIVYLSILFSCAFAIIYLITHIITCTIKNEAIRYREKPTKAFAEVTRYQIVWPKRYPFPIAPGITVATCYALLPKLTWLTEGFVE